MSTVQIWSEGAQRETKSDRMEMSEQWNEGNAGGCVAERWNDCLVYILRAPQSLLKRLVLNVAVFRGVLLGVEWIVEILTS